MTVKVRIEGLDNLQKKLARLPEGYRKGVNGAVATSALQVQGESQRLIQRGARTGVVVQRGGKPHQRSAPGEPPKTDTGRLVASIFAEIDGDGLGAEVGSGIRYASMLEFGTQKMAARPWLFPTFERLKPKIKERIEKAFRQATRKAGR